MVPTRIARFFRTAAAIAALTAASLVPGGCVNSTPLQDMKAAKPEGSDFNMALFQNYTFLARSFGDVGGAAHDVFDFNAAWSLNQTDKSIADLANTFADKAVMASRDEFVDPEIARDPASHEIRDRLLRALEPGRDIFPRDAARAQADFDCWMLNGGVDSQKAAAERCHASLDRTLPQLEKETTAAVEAAKKAQEKAQEQEKAKQEKAEQSGEMP